MVHYATVPVLYMLLLTFNFLCLTEGKGKQKNGEHSFYKKKYKKHRARRVVEVRLRRFVVQTRQRLG